MSEQGSDATAKLAPEMATFIDRVIVPALVERFLREMQGNDHPTVVGRSARRAPKRTKRTR